MSEKPSYSALERKIAVLERDIAGRIGTEKAQIANEKTYQSLFDNASVAIFRMDITEGRAIDVNIAGARLYGYASVDAFLKHYKAVNHYADLRDRDQLLKMLMEKGRCDKHLVQYKHKDGTTFWGEFSGRLLSNQVHAEGFVVDVTNQIKAEEVMKEEIDRRKRTEIALSKLNAELESRINERTAELELKNKALHESEVRYRQLFENAPIGIGVSDINGNLLEFNNAMLKPGGYSRNDIASLSNISELYMDPQQRQEITTSAIEKGFIDEKEIQFKRKDGMPYDALLSLRPIEINNVKCFQAVVQDVTDKKRAEQELRVSEEEYRQLVESMNEGMAVMNEEQKITFANNAFCRMLGYAEDELIGMKANDLHDEGNKQFPLGQIEKLKRGEHGTYELTFNRKDGGKFIAAVSPKPLFDNSGGFKCSLALFTDITERVAAQEALMKSEERFNLAVKGSNDGIWDCDLIAGSVYMSPRCKELLGYAEDEIESSCNTWESHLHPDDCERVLSQIQSHIASRLSFDSEHRLRTKTGEYRWFSNRGQAIWNEKGQAIRMAGSLRDITDIRRNEQLLESSLREKEILLREVHHRVKNNLQVISSLLSLSALKGAHLDMIKEARNRINSIALIHSQLYEAEQLDSIDISEHLRRLIPYIEEVHRDSTQNISVDVKPSLIRIPLTQSIPCCLAISEIITNSYKHAFKNKKVGKIEISLQKNDSEDICIAIRDNGSGIPQSNIDNPSGTVGLDIATKLVKDQLNGTIQFDVKNGTAVFIRFALSDNDDG